MGLNFPDPTRTQVCTAYHFWTKSGEDTVGEAVTSRHATAETSRQQGFQKQSVGWVEKFGLIILGLLVAWIALSLWLESRKK